MANKKIISLIVALLILITTSLTYKQGGFAKPEFYLYDIQAKLLRADKTASPKVKVILVDEASLKYMDSKAGRWPWPRAIWGDVLEYLSIAGARAVLFDILFIEHDRNNPANDKILQNATRKANNVYHSMLLRHDEVDEGSNDMSPALPGEFVSRFELKNISGLPAINQGPNNNDFALPIAQLPEYAKGVAVVEFKPDSDSVLRRTRPLREYQGHYFPVLGLAPFMDQNTPVSIREKSISINDRTIPLDEKGNILINMYGLNHIEQYSMSGVFQTLAKIKKGDDSNLLLSPEIFKDSIVYIGTSAIGTADLKAIPMGGNEPGVLLHAFQASNYLQNDFITPPIKSVTYLSIVAATLLTLWSVIFSKRLLMRVLLPLGMLTIYIAYALISFRLNSQVELVPFIFSSVSTGFIAFAYLTFTEGAEKRKVSQLFTQYVSKDVLDEVLNNYQEYLKSSAGQKVEITVLFSDIRGFTTMSEVTEPEKIVEMLNVHFTVMADIILKHNGTIDKYIGDAIMAFWGAPVKTANHAEQDVLAGKEMLEGLNEVNRILKERGFKHEIKIGIGINTGVATIGNIGSDKKRNYTVVGDAVNLSSRLESITKEQKTPLLFSEYTYNEIKDKIPCQHVGKVTVKGREQAVDIYTSS
jgi:adenylate cyclase